MTRIMLYNVIMLNFANIYFLKVLIVPNAICYKHTATCGVCRQVLHAISTQRRVVFVDKISTQRRVVFVDKCYML